MSGAIAISLLVCTRDRATALPTLLASIARAVRHSAHRSIEVVIVDNGSGDDTAAVLQRWRVAQTCPVRLLHEERPGLARARNRGLDAVRGNIVAMTDDDCVLHPDYFERLADCFAALGTAIVGGRILPGDTRDLPVTLKLEDHPMVASPDAFPGGFVMGANLAMTAEVLSRVGRFDERFGAGAPFVAAEDTDFLFRALGLGIPVRYDPGFTVDHHHGRRAIADETRLLAGYSFGDGALYAKHVLTDRRIATFLRRDLAALWLDVTRPIAAHQGISHFRAFCLRHKLRGMLAFALARSLAGLGRLTVLHR